MRLERTADRTRSDDFTGERASILLRDERVVLGGNPGETSAIVDLQSIIDADKAVTVTRGYIIHLRTIKIGHVCAD